MQFELNDEQSALRDSLTRLLADRYSFEKRRALATTAEGHCPQTWAQLAELGLTGLPVAEADGGFGARAEDLLPVMQELGAALSLEPYLPLRRRARGTFATQFVAPFAQYTNAHAGDGASVFQQVDRVIESGQDPRRFVEDLLERLRDLIIILAVDDGAAAHR